MVDSTYSAEDLVYYGTIIWFKKSYGFIEWYIDNIQQPDLFLHFTGIAMQGFKTVNAGQKVSFQIGTNLRGQPKAVNVVLLS